MKRRYFKYFFLFFILFIFSWLLPGPNGLIQYIKREKEARKLEREIFNIRIELAIKKLKEKIMEDSIKNFWKNY